MNTQTQKTVFVGLSGGVDSSVAALRLVRAGYSVVGVFIKVWQPDFLTCNWESERLDAMRVAATLKIPFRTFDAGDIYKKEVADYMISEYRKGRTPNPDSMCNQHVKFGAFLEYAKSAGADYVATGHYAQRKNIHGVYELHKGVDENKDQSYFLWSLTQKELQYVLFPVGDTNKEIIRREAKRAGLDTAEKKDSQGVCFLGQLDMEEFLSHYIEKKDGDVLFTDGRVIGTHTGAWFYTIGQRHGITYQKSSSDQMPLYVIDKDIKENTITVAPAPPLLDKGVLLKLSDVRFTASKLAVGDTVKGVIRYREIPLDAVVTAVYRNTLTLRFNTLLAPTLGQSCVLYDGTKCLGGGIIERIDN